MGDGEIKIGAYDETCENQQRAGKHSWNAHRVKFSE